MSIKYNRTRQKSKIGDSPESFSAMWAHIPASVRESLSASKLADLVDAFWDCAGQSKMIASDEAIENGFVWDRKRNIARDVQTAHH